MDVRLGYRAMAAQGATPLRLVILLYDQAIADLHSALSALARGDIEGRTRMINHAFLVIGYLQGTLNKDHGGKVAEDLERFYGKLRAGLVQAQFRQSEARLRRQLADLMKVREAWEHVDQLQADAARRAAHFSENEPDGQPATIEWRG